MMIFSYSQNCGRIFTRLLAVLVIIGLFSGCATRQISDSLRGSTAQRLVTYSLERFIAELSEQAEFEALDDKSVELNVYFLEDHALLEYATELLRQKLIVERGATLVSDGTADYQVNVLFNSIGTDHDSYGLTLPTFGFAATPDSRINILAVDMYHGVTEGYAVLQSAQGDDLSRTKRILVRIRADNVATPIVDFPINQLELADPYGTA